MSKRLIALATSALLIGGLFVGAPVRVRAVTDTVYVADVASAGAGGSCSAPNYATGVLDDDEAIQDAIDAVDTSPSLTTVYLCAGTYNITATLEPTEDITFIVAGAATTILDGGAIYTGGNYVSGGVSILFSLDSVTVEGLTFQHGANNLTYDVGNYATWGGGAINSYTVTVIDSTFTQNKADSYGGAIWTYGPSTIQGDSVFTENIATFGGAIYNYSGEDLTIQGNSVFTGNEAYNGGAIFSWGHTRVTNGTFSNNESDCNGGAIAANNDVTVTSSTFTGNVTDCNGGAIRASNGGPTGNVYVTSSTFTSNASGSVGGAISSDSVTVASSTFTGNLSSNNGGAIYANDDVTVTSSVFTSNVADDYGGAIDLYGDLVVSGSTFRGNEAGDGGAIEASGDTATVTRSTFTNNFANDGDGGAIEANNLFVTASTFKGNDADDDGGAIRASTTATVTNSAFTSNSASREGGAIWAVTGTVGRSRFTRNTAGQHGGAILFYSPAPTDLRLMRRNTFSRNTAPAGGAITFGPCETPSRSQAARVERANRFSGNRATEQRRTNNIERWEGGCG